MEKLYEYVENLFRNGLETNIYSALIIGFVEASLKDLNGDLQLYHDKRKELKRKRLEDLYTFYSRVVTEYFCDLFKRNIRNNSLIEKLLEEARSWINDIFETTCKIFNIVFLVNIETKTKLTICTRNPYMPLEVGVAWHPYFNLPYIPSTSLKGLMKSYFLLNDIKICGLNTLDLFGSKEYKGILTFFDALPSSFKNSLIDPDVLTPHYQEIGGKIDEKSVKPRPLVYPVISSGVKFSTIIAVDLSNVDIDSKTFINEFQYHLNKAFFIGVGARTTLGYGVVKVRIINVKEDIG